MSNIVERLRSPATVFYEYAADDGAFLREAADEITRLRAENEKLREALKPFAALLAEDDENYIVASPSLSDLRRARAAIESVTEPQQSGAGNE